MAKYDWKTRLYSCWHHMKARCDGTTDKYSSSRYKGRGITYCDEWKEWEVFKEWALTNGYSDALSLDRIDNNKGYSPDNCRWATQKEQTRNRSTTVRVIYYGKEWILRELCEAKGVDVELVYSRLHHQGWSLRRALNTPKLREGTRKKPHTH